MKKLLALLFSISMCFSYSQQTGFFNITDRNDDGDEVFNTIPVLDREYLRLGWSPDGLPIYTGLRFQNVTIPKGSEVLSAHIQFTAFHDIMDTIYMKIKGELSPNAAPITNEVGSISLRHWTGMSNSWTTQNWQFFTPGPDQRTSNLNEVIEEIINQDGWVSGNAMLIIFYPYVTGEEVDTLTAMSYEYDLGEWYAPQLIVEYINWSDVAEAKQNGQFSMYPNPVHSVFSIQSEIFSQQSALMEIHYLNGRILLKKNFPKGSCTRHIDVTSLQCGIYFCTLKTTEGNTSKKLIIQK